jgi:hypothetical protein
MPQFKTKLPRTKMQNTGQLRTASHFGMETEQEPTIIKSKIDCLSHQHKPSMGSPAKCHEHNKSNYSSTNTTKHLAAPRRRYSQTSSASSSKHTLHTISPTISAIYLQVHCQPVHPPYPPQTHLHRPPQPTNFH